MIPPAADALTLRLACVCGACADDVRILPAVSPARCHCSSCRHYYGAAFATLLAISPDVSLASALASATSAQHTCSTLGTVDRYFCRRCYSNLATVARAQPTDVSAGSSAFVHLGCVEDSSIPSQLAARWTRRCDSWAEAERPRWPTARPWPSAALGGRYDRPALLPGARVASLVGRCACGGCAWQASCGEEFQLQHCYCQLCRKMSGSAFQTWIPVRGALPPASGSCAVPVRELGGRFGYAGRGRELSHCTIATRLISRTPRSCHTAPFVI